MGADHLINYRTTPAGASGARADRWPRRDHVIEVGGPATLAQSMVAARIGGHISVIGILTGIAGELQLVPALVRQLRLQGVLVGSRTQQQEMIRAIDANGIRPVIDKRFALDEIVEAFRYRATSTSARSAWSSDAATCGGQAVRRHHGRLCWISARSERCRGGDHDNKDDYDALATHHPVHSGGNRRDELRGLRCASGRRGGCRSR